MVGSLSEFAKLVALGWWGLLSGAAGLGVAFVWDWISPSPDLPWWAKWALTAGLALMGASFQAFHEVRTQRDARTALTARRDWRLGDLLRHLEKYVYVNSDAEKFKIILTDIRQKARDGQMFIWGRQYDAVTKTSSGPWLLIDEAYWTSFQLEHNSCFDEAYRETAPTDADYASKTERDGVDPLLRMPHVTVMLSADPLFAELMVSSRNALPLYRLPWSRRTKNWLRAKLWDWLHS